MSATEGEDALLAGAPPQRVRRRLLRGILLTLVTQYVIITGVVGISVATVLHFVVTPQVVAQFEAIETALKRLPPR